MVSREDLKEIKNYLSKELSKNYEVKAPEMTVFEPNKNIRIDEKRHSGDLTRDVYYLTEDLSSFVGYVSFFKKRHHPYAVCIADGGGITFHKKAGVAADEFSSRCMGRIEEIIEEHENQPQEHRPHAHYFQMFHE